MTGRWSPRTQKGSYPRGASYPAEMAKITRQEEFRAYCREVARTAPPLTERQRDVTRRVFASVDFTGSVGITAGDSGDGEDT